MAGHWYLTRIQDRREKYRRFEEVFRGCKKSQAARAWPLISTLKMISFVIIICWFDEDQRIWALSTILSLQIVYLSYVVIVNPFAQWVDYIVELTTSGMFALQMIFLYFQDNKSSWSDEMSLLYLISIMATVAVSALAILGTAWFYSSKIL